MTNTIMNDPQAISDKGSRTAKLLGVDAEQGRWLFVALGFATKTRLGSICPRTLMRVRLQKLFSVDATASALPFIVSVQSLPF